VFSRQGWVAPTLLVDGRVAGVWSHQHDRNRVRVEIELFRPLRRDARDELHDEVARLAAFLGGSPELAFST